MKAGLFLTLIKAETEIINYIMKSIRNVIGLLKHTHINEALTRRS